MRFGLSKMNKNNSQCSPGPDVIDKLFGSRSQAAQTKINMPSLATRQLMSLATRVTQYLHGMLKNYVVSVSVQFNNNT